MTAVTRKRKLVEQYQRGSLGIEIGGEDLRSNDGDSEYSGLKLGVPHPVVGERRVGTTSMATSSSQDCDGHHPTTEQHIEEDGEQSEECDAAQETSEEGCKAGVDDSCSRDAFDRLEPCWNVMMLVCLIWMQ